jgi:drug/metabolite transporter (DMT)-like permease
MNNKTAGILWVLVCVMLWGLIPVVARLGQASLDNHQFLFWSSLISFIVLFFNAALAGEVREVRSYLLADWAMIILLGLLGTYIYYLFLYLGYARAKGLEVLVIQYTWPIIIVILSAFILKESITFRKTISIALGFLGVIVVLSKGEFSRIDVSNPSVILLVGAGAFCFALFSVLSKKVKKSPTIVVSLYFLVALVASFLSMLYFSALKFPQFSDWFPITLNGLLVNGYSYIFWKKALRSAEASFIAPFVYIAPVISAIYLVFLFNEPFLMVYAIGLVLIILGGVINSRGTLVS